jgi:hypothetical protein
MLPEYQINLSDLPSKGKTYANFTIKTFPYTLGDMFNLNQRSMGKLELIEFLAGGIKVTNGKVEDITVADFFYICLYRHLQTVQDNKFEIYNIICDECGHEHNSVTVNVKDINIKDLEKDFPLKIEFSDKNVVFTPLTLGNYLVLLKSQEEYITNPDDFPIKHINWDLYALSLCIDNEQTVIENYTYIYNLYNNNDITIVQSLKDDLDYGNSYVNIACSECKEEMKIYVEDPAIFIRPF